MSKIDNRRRNKLAKLRRHALVDFAYDCIRTNGYINVGLRIVLDERDRPFLRGSCIIQSDQALRIHEKQTAKLIEALDALYVQRAHVESW